MVSFKYLLGLLSIISLPTSVFAVKPVDSWDDLPDCARLCFTFSDGNGAPPAGPCTVLDQKCLCTQGLWRRVFSTCMRLGDPVTHAVHGCVNEKSQIIDGVLDWISDYYCPTVNGTEEPDRSYSSWYFVPATTASTTVRNTWTQSSTSTVTVSTSVLTSVISSSALPIATSSSVSTSLILDNSTITTQALPATPAVGPSTDDTHTIFRSTVVSTIHVTESNPEASASASSTSISGVGSIVYIKTMVVLSFWVVVYFV